VEIRLAEPGEYAEAGEVTAGAYVEFARPGDPGWDGYLDELRDVAGRVDRTDVLVAVQDGRVLGCVTIEMDHTVGDDDQELPAGVSSVRMLAVRAEARGRGIGKALMEACLQRSREAGKTVVVLRTTHRMKVAQGMYERMGFERDPARDEHLESGLVLLAYRLALE
jgi:ribosomal protein S18 acetylase RimI-like enzyme